MLNCRKIIDQADSHIARETSFWQRLKITLHLFMCVHCRRYVRQLQLLVSASENLHGEASDDEIQKIVHRCQHHHDDKAKADKTE